MQFTDILSSIETGRVSECLKTDNPRLRGVVLDLCLGQASKDFARLFAKDTPNHEEWIAHLMKCCHEILLKYESLALLLGRTWMDEVLQLSLGTDVGLIKGNLSIYLLSLYERVQQNDGVVTTRDLVVVSALRALHWEPLVLELLQENLISVINSKLRSWNEEAFDVEIVPKLRALLDTEVTPIVRELLPSPQLGQLMNSLLEHAYNEYIHARIDRMFEMVTDYPESLPAIKELRDVVLTTSQLERISRDIRQIFQKRLLHLGASTSQILDVYVLLIRSLRHIDPSDMLLSYVADPIRSYLMKRKDTIRCIVTAMTEEGTDSTLKGELNSGGSSLEYQPDEDDEDDGPGEVEISE